MSLIDTYLKTYGRNMLGHMYKNSFLRTLIRLELKGEDRKHE